MGHEGEGLALSTLREATPGRTGNAPSYTMRLPASLPASKQPSAVPKGHACKSKAVEPPLALQPARRKQHAMCKIPITCIACVYLWHLAAQLLGAQTLWNPGKRTLSHTVCEPVLKRG
jgi:hypothetical protein